MQTPSSFVRRTQQAIRSDLGKFGKEDELGASVNAIEAHGVLVSVPLQYLSPAHTPKYPRNFLSFRSALHTHFSPLESSLVYSVEVTAPENEGDNLFAKFHSLPTTAARLGLHWTKAADDLCRAVNAELRLGRHAV